MIMPKAAVSVTLDRDNLRWLEARQRVTGGRSLSQTLDDVVTAARRTAGTTGPARSVVGTMTIPVDDPDLAHADDFVRELFAASLSRPFDPMTVAKPIRPRRPRRPRATRGRQNRG
jgi:hypothetical protein